MRFHQADPAGWMFFGRAFELAHDSMEDLLLAAGFDWKEWFANERFAMPIRQAQADYRRPIPAGALYEVEAVVRRLGDTSVSFRFTFRAVDTDDTGNPSEGAICLILDSTHVLLDLRTKTPAPWPAEFREKLAAFMSPAKVDDDGDPTRRPKGDPV